MKRVKLIIFVMLFVFVGCSNMMESPDEQAINDRPTTTISFDVTEENHVYLYISDSNFEFVKMLIDEELGYGQYSVPWNGTNYNDDRVASGVYYFTIIIEDYVNTQPMVLLN